MQTRAANRGLFYSPDHGGIVAIACNGGHHRKTMLTWFTKKQEFCDRSNIFQTWKGENLYKKFRESREVIASIV